MNNINEELVKTASIQVLSHKTKSLVSALLNPTKVIPTEKGLPRDWEGLAALCKIKGELISSIHNDKDPTNKVLELWIENDHENSTIGKFLLFLEELDRFDIIEDITALLHEDIKRYNKQPLKTKPINLTADRDIFTIDDVSRINDGLEPQMYDAFVLFADDDIGFATELIEKMEKQYKMKLCAKERDLVAGTFEYDAVTRLIAERCNRLIVILSQAFFDSSANTFYLKYAQYVGLDQSQRKVIPCIYRPCKYIPPSLSCYFMLDVERANKNGTLWDKLRDSIKAPSPEAYNTLLQNRNTSEKVNSKNLDNIDSITVYQETNLLRPINNSVKFSSMVNLNESVKIITDQSLSAGTSTNSLSVYSETCNNNNNNKKNKTKTNWLKKILHKNNNQKNKVLESEKNKRRFWGKQNKRKVALAN